MKIWQEVPLKYWIYSPAVRVLWNRRLSLREKWLVLRDIIALYTMNFQAALVAVALRYDPCVEKDYPCGLSYYPCGKWKGLPWLFGRFCFHFVGLDGHVTVSGVGCWVGCLGAPRLLPPPSPGSLGLGFLDPPGPALFLFLFGPIYPVIKWTFQWWIRI